MLVRSPFMRQRLFDWSFDRAFEDLVDSFFSPSRYTPTAPTVTSSWEDGGLKLTVDLPGIPQEAVDVSVAGRVLAISVKTDELSWERTLSLGADLDPDNITAHYANGRLTVMVHPVPEAQPRRIEITSGAPAAIEAGEAGDAEKAPQAEMETSTTS